MAKRKRLNPLAFSGEDFIPSDLETKSATGAPPISGIVHDAATTAALDEMSQVLRSAREEGRMVLDLPLAQIQLNHLVRDRVATDPAEMAALVNSLRSRGQQQPIEVVALGPDSYGLVSGWRRCQALLQLAQSDGRPAQVLALLRQPKEASDAYLAMVEENEIRVGLSYYERARIVLRAVEQGVYDSDKSALQALFSNASRSKRSKIGSFLHIVRALDDVLRFPTNMAERAGLMLARRLEDDPTLGAKLTAKLRANPPETFEVERAMLEDAGAGSQPPATAPKERGKPSVPRNTAADQSPVEAAQTSTQAQPKKVGAAVWVQDHPDGSMTIQGPGLTKARRDSLLKWISVNL